METINDRIKQVRQEVGLSQADFAKRMGISQTNLSWLEKAGNKVSEQNIKIICWEFNISEKWLHEGVGEMCKTNFESIINSKNLDEIDKEIIMAYATATKDQKDFIKTLIKNVAQKMNLLDREQELVKTDDELTREEKHRLLDEELDKMEKGQTLSVSTTTNGLLNQEKINNS